VRNNFLLIRQLRDYLLPAVSLDHHAETLVTSTTLRVSPRRPEGSLGFDLGDLRHFSVGRQYAPR
jgi:hypothetical protein